MLSGGCQCGAVRFRVPGPPRGATVCHCRMCQKQFAAPFGAFAAWLVGDVQWTRGERKRFHSSDAVARGFCGDCGTPLTYEPIWEGRHIAIAVCAFDDPGAWPPQLEIGVESRLGWLSDINGLARLTPEQQAQREAEQPPLVSHQHPDHDTAVWPPEESAS